MPSTDHQPSPSVPRCNASQLAGIEASFRHWHFCELEPGHMGAHRCTSCHVEALAQLGRKARGSGQLGAGVDVILEMREQESDPTLRKIRARGRVAMNACSVRYTACRYEIENGQMSLQMRVYRAIEAQPGISKRALRDAVTGKAAEVDAALLSLTTALAVENRGDKTAGQCHVRSPRTAEGPGLTWDTPRDTGCAAEPSDAVQSGTRLGHTPGQCPTP